MSQCGFQCKPDNITLLLDKGQNYVLQTSKIGPYPSHVSANILRVFQGLAAWTTSITPRDCELYAFTESPSETRPV